MLMNKNILITVGALGVLLLGTYFFVIYGKKGSESFFGSTPEGIKCVQVNAVGDAGSSQGTIYIYKDLSRYDSVIKHKDAGTKEMHILHTKDKTYAWGSIFELPNGASMALVFNNDEEEPEMIPQEDIDIDYLKEHDYKVPGLNCEPWEPDMDLLSPPKDVKFQTQEEMMNSMMQGAMNPMMQGAEANTAPSFVPMGGGMPGALDCSICAQIPDANAKAQCEKQCK